MTNFFFSKSKNLGFGLRSLKSCSFLNWHCKVNSHTKLCSQKDINAPGKKSIRKDRVCTFIFSKCQAVANRVKKNIFTDLLPVLKCPKFAYSSCSLMWHTLKSLLLFRLLSDTSPLMVFNASFYPLPSATSNLLSFNFSTFVPAHQNFISHLLDLLGFCLDVILQSVFSTLHGL